MKPILIASALVLAGTFGAAAGSTSFPTLPVLIFPGVDGTVSTQSDIILPADQD